MPSTSRRWFIPNTRPVDPSPSQSSGVIRTIWPAPAGNPNPKFEMYSLPSGPGIGGGLKKKQHPRTKGLAVGSASPVAITFDDPEGSMRRTCPINGIGIPAAGLISSTYMRSRLSKTMPSTVVKPVASVLIWPVGVILKTLELPGTRETSPDSRHRNCRNRREPSARCVPR
jgi:hypothetical protein